MSDIVILSGARTAIGAFQGALKDLSSPALGARAIQGALERAGLEPAQVEQVNMGCVLTAGVGQAPARQAAIKAGIPVAAGALTVGKVCGSGLQAVIFGAKSIALGDAQIVVAGGMESMSNVPYYLPQARTGYRMGHGKIVDGMIHDGLWDPYGDFHMGQAGETCAKEYAFTREMQDDYAKESFRRALSAQKEGQFKAEIVGQCQRGHRSIAQVAKDFDLTETAVREWVRQAERDAGTRDDGGLSSDEKAELAALRRENRRLREDVEILKRATAFFAKETR